MADTFFLISIPADGKVCGSWCKIQTEVPTEPDFTDGLVRPVEGSAFQYGGVVSAGAAGDVVPSEHEMRVGVRPAEPGEIGRQGMVVVEWRGRWFSGHVEPESVPV